MANFVATLSKLTSLANYPFWKIHVKLTLTLITYPRAVLTAEGMLNALALPQTTNMDEVTRRDFLGSQALCYNSKALELT